MQINLHNSKKMSIFARKLEYYEKRRTIPAAAEREIS